MTAEGPSSAGSLELTVLGSSSSIPRPGRACSAYLVRAPGIAVVFDLGSGAFANLRVHMAAEDVDAVVISHMHPDHFLDVVPMRYALRYGARAHDRRPVLYLPPGGEASLRAMAATFAVEVSKDFLDVYDIRAYDPERALEVGGLTLRFALTQHYIPAYAVRAEAAGRSITYSADTAPESRVTALAQGTDAFLCEATLASNARENGERGHSSAREAGAMAQDAGARKLILTHYGAETSATQLLSESRAVYSGDIVVADDHTRLQI